MAIKFVNFNHHMVTKTNTKQNQIRFYHDSHPLTLLNWKTLSKINKNNEIDKYNFVHESYFSNVMFIVAGGPGSGKTTLFSNLKELFNEKGENIDTMLKIGARLASALQSPQPSLESVFRNRRPILIDNHGSKKKILTRIIDVARKYNYYTIMIHPHIDKETFRNRLESRKQEINREYCLKSFWKDHQLFANNLDKYINNYCPFNTLIIYDNRLDDSKKLIYVKHNNKPYIFNEQLLYESVLAKVKKEKMDIKSQKISNDKRTKFIIKREFMTIDLKQTFTRLFDHVHQTNKTIFDKKIDFESI